MKNNKIQRAMAWFTASLLLVALGCSPIEDRDHLELAGHKATGLYQFDPKPQGKIYIKLSMI